MSDEVLLAISTFPDADLASRVGRELVERKLAACANIGRGVQSIYRWDGKVEEANETLVFFKTTRSRFDEFAQALRSMHPYELPEIIAVRIDDGFAPYLEWVASSCAPSRSAITSASAATSPSTAA